MRKLYKLAFKLMTLTREHIKIKMVKNHISSQETKQNFRFPLPRMNTMISTRTEKSLND